MKETYESLILFVNEQLEELGLVNYRCTSIKPTRYSAHDFGVARMYIKVKDQTLPDDHLLNNAYFYCFYSLAEINREIKNGGSLFIKTENKSICNFELTIIS